jgi:hypothetical protein
MRAALDEFLDLVGDVRDDLHGLAQVVATAFFLEHGLVDRPVVKLLAASCAFR